MAAVPGSHERPDAFQHLAVFVYYGAVAHVQDVLDERRACPAAVQRCLLVHIAGAGLVLEGGTHYFQHSGTHAGLTVRLADWFLACRQNHAAPGAQFLEAAVLTAPAAACAVGQHIHDLFQALLLVACKLALVYAEREVAVKAGHSLKRHLGCVEVCHKPLRVAPGGQGCFQGCGLTAPAATPVVHEEDSLLDDRQQGSSEAGGQYEAEPGAAAVRSHACHPGFQGAVFAVGGGPAGHAGFNVQHHVRGVTGKEAVV